MKTHVLVLADLDSELLIVGLSEAMQTATGWLTPAQVYDICMGGSRADLAQQAAEEAWAWLLQFVKWHGSDGHPKMAPLRFTEDYVPIVDPPTPAPEIPERSRQVLELLGGTVVGGLDKLRLTPTVELGWLKKEFIAAHVRGGRLA